MIRRLGPLGLSLALLLSIGPSSPVAAGSSVTVDNAAGNGIATGTVVRSDPTHALLEVTNNYHFWVAVELVSANGAVLRPAALSEDLGGLFAGGGLINPGGTAAWDGVFDSSTGGVATIRVHYDVTSAGGAVALAGNVLTIIADSLGASIATSSATNLVKAFTLIMDLPSFADLGRGIQKQDVWGLATSMEILLGSSTGRATIKEALAEAGVLASDGDLLKVASVVGIIDWARTLFDLMRASIGGNTDGTVTFAVAERAVTLPTPTPTPVAAPPAAVPTISTQSIHRQAADGRWVADFEEPVVSGIPSTTAGAINQTIRAKVDAYIANVDQPPVMPGDDPSSVTGSFKVAFVSSSLLSIEFKVERYRTGWGHGVEMAGSLTFAVSSGVQIHLGDLFSDQAAGLAALQTQAHILALQLLGHTLLVDPATWSMADFDKAWAFSVAGLRLSFTQGDIAGMAAGPLTITIPWSSLVEVLKQDGPAGSFLK